MPRLEDSTMRSSRTLLAIFMGLATILAGLSARAADDLPDNKARLTVRLPARAQLMVRARLSKQKGEERTLASPPLAEGKTYTFRLTATWTERGESKKVVRAVKVKAGARELIDLRLADVPPLKKQKKPKTPSPENKTGALPTS